jgi:hypothetical protein
MKIIGIRTNDGYYISDNIENKAYYNSGLGGLLINNELPQPTFKKDWFKVKEKPTLIQKTIKGTRVNRRYELINKDLKTSLEEVIPYENVFDEDSDMLEYFQGIKGLYEFKYDTTEDTLEEVPFDFEEILKIEEIKEPNALLYKRYDSYSTPVSNLSSKDIKYDFVAEIITPSILLHTQPCKLSRKESYDIVRAYIKDNIDPKVAEITSDYNFCFTVKKRIPLAKPYEYEVNVNAFKGKRKPKYEKRIMKESKVTIFEVAPERYNSYTVIEPFVGENQEDLQKNIDAYLSNIIGIINEPLKFCSCCNGTGVIFNKEI